MKDYKKPEDLIVENGLLKQQTKKLPERAMQAEMTEHLSQEKNASSRKNSGNSRNGTYKMNIKGEFCTLDGAASQDRNSTFGLKWPGQGRTPGSEEHWKAVCGKTACTV